MAQSHTKFGANLINNMDDYLFKKADLSYLQGKPFMGITLKSVCVG